MAQNSRLTGFRTLTVQERREAVARESGVEPAVFDALEPGGLGVEAAEHMIENVVGVMGIPVGIATNVTVNGRDVLVPMATEEPSVVAAASNAARIARVRGGFTTSSTGPVMQAQVQVVDVVDPAGARLRVLEARDELIALAAAQDPKLAEVGGGVLDLTVRTVEAPGATYVVAHLVVDVRDAMGANAVNTMAEAVAPRLAEIAGGRAVLRILTNKADLRLSRARAVLDAEALGGAEIVDDMIHAYRLAAADPYRAATHNKGIMNGVSAVVLATGNDTRAVEAGAHSHAVNADGVYSSLSTFEKNADGDIVATLELPMPVGLVGGATRSHPAARAAIAVTEVTTARELGELVTAVGLAQNIAAVRALAGEGIQRGHMSLHAKNIAIAVGAAGGEVDRVVAVLISEKAFRHDRAEAVLAEIRSR
ncbi:hydroxymethylglutaryl-CoA reductase, degradative [Nocardiopsis sp. NPDC006198]|uniref:3-hydroxy-3-methylglutaryl coenzyme A reductase n=1 Tax=Streptomonospora nanhaiensis TaxID=1323731 RepID=A0ABY6YI01_9ACTN|nr:hydroxymethylglutaryl-CoA reductase, degradative [Streptomonospora nanhaiensis]WAE71844.1 hydroxymethylglutaryl-CoA reductase, degradative [Streptomonospora nanhaiensis]